MYKNHYVSAIIAAAGMSNRMRSSINKQFISIDNKPILAHTIEKFERCRYVDEIIVVAKEDEMGYCKREIINKHRFKKAFKIVRGGKERQDSVYNGILALNGRTDIVLSHDGARPFVKGESIVESIRGAIEYGACVVGVPVKNTIKVVGDDDTIDRTPKRDLLWAAQTPQCFDKDILMEGYRKAIEDNFIGTDDSVLVERLGVDVRMIMGSYDNIKITTPEDLMIAESILKGEESIFDRMGLRLQSR
ncbi:MAG: 2-C-methyl-D-erythritol 4-phosphate cytidylyltransferase [Tissierellia bacterium]|nr:2-C-methyl-D-erythritol 4-phosphate cytidylyltransferase [Tissierellia bacterium]